MTRKGEYILILALILINIAGIGIGIWNYTSQDTFINEKTVILKDNTQSEEMSVNLSGIAPGVKTSYTLNLKANKNDRFDAVINFQKIGSDSLAEFIDVEIVINEEKIGKASLSELLNGKTMGFHVEFSSDEAVAVEIIYTMGLHVGDEAQGTSANFNMILTATR